MIILPEKQERHTPYRGNYVDIPNWYHQGFTTVDILEFLKGRKLDDVAKSYISGFEPANDLVEVCTNGQTMQARQDKHITVWLNEDQTIRRIEYHIRVNLYGDLKNGHDLRCRI